MACNHPNSFFDALLLGAFFKHPVHFLARGDAFKNALVKTVLKALKVVPIYRLTEGKEYLAFNDQTFEKCTEVLKRGGIILIFSEGLCINEWQLRPLKKGTARIALKAWKEQKIAHSFRVLPVSFNYSTFHEFRKRVVINFEKPIAATDINLNKSLGEQIQELNERLFERLKQNLLIQGENETGSIQFLINNSPAVKRPGTDAIKVVKRSQQAIAANGLLNSISKLKGTKKFPVDTWHLAIHFLVLIVLFIPSIAAYIVHVPVYTRLSSIIRNKTKGTVFYHSVLFGTLIIVYPLCLFTLSLILFVVFKKPVFMLVVFILPLSALLLLSCKDSLEAIMNYWKLRKNERKVLQQILKL